MKEYRKSTGFKTLIYVLFNMAIVAASILLVMITALAEEGIYDKSIYELEVSSFELKFFMRGRYPFFFVDSIYDLVHYKYLLIILLIVCVAISLILAILNVNAAGFRKGSDEIVTTWWDKLPIEIVLCIFATGLIIACSVAAEEAELVTVGGWAVLVSFLTVCANMVYFAAVNVAIRIKQKAYKQSITYWILHALHIAGKRTCHAVGGFIKEVFSRLPLLWRTIVIMVGLLFLEFLSFGFTWPHADSALVFWVIRSLILLPAVIYLALMLRKLEEAGEKLADGDFTYKTDLKTLFWDFKKHAETLNRIGDGMEIALKERMKSEHLKTELITNVSHDIKTPLTSIINYATLIGEEETDNEKIKEYSEVLVRQSTKLKRLTEDLVEASKATTGNLEVSLQPCDASIFLTQASGEYEEKLQTNNLTLIVKAPEENISIMADGRRMWRVFDNLMNNISKYSLPNSRVYLGLESVGNNAVFTFKNTSKDELDISEEELMERFVRGDKSRNTEGNGLGLAIAKSMTELQGGSLRITIDGDLFKAILTFPKI